MAKNKHKAVSTKTPATGSAVLEEIQAVCEKTINTMKKERPDIAMFTAAMGFTSIASMCSGAIAVLDEQKKD